MKSKKEVNKICKDCECNNNGWCVMLETNDYKEKAKGCLSMVLDNPNDFVNMILGGEQQEEVEY